MRLPYLAGSFHERGMPLFKERIRAGEPCGSIPSTQQMNGDPVGAEVPQQRQLHNRSYWGAGGERTQRATHTPAVAFAALPKPRRGMRRRIHDLAGGTLRSKGGAETKPVSRHVRTRSPLTFRSTELSGRLVNCIDSTSQNYLITRILIPIMRLCFEVSGYFKVFDRAIRASILW